MSAAIEIGGSRRGRRSYAQTAGSGPAHDKTRLSRLSRRGRRYCDRVPDRVRLSRVAEVPEAGHDSPATEGLGDRYAEIVMAGLEPQ
jgi:hypothetical protein